MTKKISLSEWAAREFDPPPADRTLRLWVKEGRIVPAPIKIGRTYYVYPTAKHIAEAQRILEVGEYRGAHKPDA